MRCGVGSTENKSEKVRGGDCRVRNKGKERLSLEATAYGLYVCSHCYICYMVLSAMEVIRRGKDIGTWAALESADVPGAYRVNLIPMCIVW